MPILAAIDETDRSRRVVEVGYDLAVAFDEPLIVLHVIPEEDFDDHKADLSRMRGFSDYSFTHEERSAEGFVEEYVEGTISDLDEDLVEPLGRIGPITDTILDETHRIDPRYLVIGGRRRSPVGKALFGNRTQEILLSAEHPVVTTMSS